MTDTDRRNEVDGHVSPGEIRPSNHGLVFVLHAFFDESIRTEHDVFAFAGYTFSSEEVRELEDRWQDALRECDIYKSAGIANFHMKEYVRGRTGQGPLKRLHDEQREADRILRQLHWIINKTMFCAFCVAVDVRAWKTLPAQYRPERDIRDPLD